MVRPKKTPTARNRSSATETQVTLNESSSLGADEEEPAQVVNVSTRAARANQKAAAAAKAKTQKTMATSVAEPPRTRRMASLNAEFLVHYCSSSNHVSSNALKTTQASNNSAARKSSDSIVNTKKNKVNGNKRSKTTRASNRNVCESSDSNSEHELTIDYSKMQTKANQIEQIGIENYANILNDFAVQEDDNENSHTEEDKEHNNEDQVEEEHDDEYVENLKKRKGVKRKPAAKTKQPAAARKQPASKSKKAKKTQITASEASDDDETPPKKAAVEEAPSGRPKREAGLRASAMIIQTNEIEKTKFQYNYTNSSSECKQPLELPPAKLKTTTSFNNFQIPAASPKPNQLNKKTSQLLKQISSTSTMLALSLPPACPLGEDDSSNDILIIDTPKSTQYVAKSASASKTGEPHVPTLTEELIIEHNKLHGSVGCGNGTFSSFTRDYITKWTLDYEPTDEKPFTAGLIPIESFGVKVLNEPQYLQNKSRLGGGGGAAAAPITVPPPPVSIVKVALNQTLNQKVKKEDSPKQNCCQQQQQQPQQPKSFTTNNNNNSNENLNSLDINKLSLLNDLKRTNELSSILINTNLKVAAKVNDTSNNNTNNTDSSSSDNNITSGLNYFPAKCIPA